MKAWYVLYVASGCEESVGKQLDDIGLPTLVPREQIHIRRHGTWHMEVRPLFPCYVFVFCEYDAQIYHTLRTVHGVIKILPSAMEPVPLSIEEYDGIIQLCPDDDPLGVSDIVKVGDTIEVVSGALKRMEGSIVMLNVRQRRATIRLPILGQERNVTLAINLITKSDAPAG